MDTPRRGPPQSFISEGRTKYPSTVRSPIEGPMLKSGANNKKLGKVVAKGPLLGAEIFSLSLEERATCPQSCLMWANCYGNNMPFAHRFDYTHPEFINTLYLEVSQACEKHRLVLIRLHVLGDFYSCGYLAVWDQMMRENDNLHVFGYTAHHPTTEIGRAVDNLVDTWGWERWAIRHSGLDSDVRSALVGDQHPHVDSFWCPEQTGQAASCAECGACWNGMTAVRFTEH